MGKRGAKVKEESSAEGLPWTRYGDGGVEPDGLPPRLIMGPGS